MLIYKFYSVSWASIGTCAASYALVVINARKIVFLLITSTSKFKFSLYIESIITDKYEIFYTPPDPIGIGGFFC